MARKRSACATNHLKYQLAIKKRDREDANAEHRRAVSEAAKLEKKAKAAASKVERLATKATKKGQRVMLAMERLHVGRKLKTKKT